jgi:16S rRNA (uracil1498-N3)-methyltransferase
MKTHEFALYHKLTSFLPLTSGTLVSISDESLVHRMKHVLRLKIGDVLSMFDEQHNMHVRIANVGKKSIDIIIERYVCNHVYTPKLTVQLALLKREALQEAVVLLTCLGASVIKLFVSERVQREWDGQREYNRLYRCMIAAAEQSKNFSVPVLDTPITLAQLMLQKSHEQKLVCSINAPPLATFLKETRNNISNIIVLVGPEGDLTVPEYQLVHDAGYQGYRLTPTILRSEQAAALAVGMIRSWY